MYAKSLAAVVAAVLLGTGVGYAQSHLARHFRLEWQASNARPAVTGYIYNDHPSLSAVNVRLLVQELGPAGQVVSETIGYVDSEIAPGGRGYFEVPVRAAFATYQVVVEFADLKSPNRMGRLPRKEHSFSVEPLQIALGRSPAAKLP